jgi:hypothetical protein
VLLRTPPASPQTAYDPDWDMLDIPDYQPGIRQFTRRTRRRTGFEQPAGTTGPTVQVPTRPGLVAHAGLPRLSEIREQRALTHCELVVALPWPGVLPLMIDTTKALNYYLVPALPYEPKTWAQSQRLPEAAEWKAAAELEIKLLQDREVFELVDRPHTGQVLTSKWIFKVKTKADGSFDRFRARLVARGYEQRLGEHYSEIYAPTATYDILRLLMAMACAFDWEVEVIDISQAFTYAPLDIYQYMEQPEGFVDPLRPHSVWLMKKALYGLKQAPRMWYKALHEHLVNVHQMLKVPPFDNLYLKKWDGHVLLVLVYVDDLLIISDRTSTIRAFKTLITRTFQCKDLGQVSVYLGLQIVRDRVNRRMWMGQPRFIADLLKKFSIQTNGNPSTPLPADFTTVLRGEMLVDGNKWVANPSTEENLSPLLPARDVKLYQSLIGALNFAACCTRPDISYAVSRLASVAHAPRMRHLKAATRCLQYLVMSPDLSLYFCAPRGKLDLQLKGACDASYASCPLTMRSITGYIYTLAGGPVCWYSKRQSAVTTSVCEAEYVALNEAVKACDWVRKTLADLLCPREGPTPIGVDNSAAISLVNRPQQHSRTRHVHVAFSRVREKVDNGEVVVVKVPGDRQPADFLTKNVCAPELEMAKELIGLAPPWM